MAMLSDDERLQLVLGDEPADDAARAEAALLAAALADPATWQEPPAELEALIVDQVREEAALGRPVAAASRPGRPAHIRRWAVPLVGVAAAGVIALGAGLALTADEDDDPVALAALTSETDPDVSGEAEVFDTDSGFAIRMELQGLPLLPDGGFYEAWVRDEDGTLVSIGTFSQSAGPITLWAGVDPCEFGGISVTRERPDGDPTSSGDRVLGGPVVCDS
jgi:hypothetical protein